MFEQVLGIVCLAAAVAILLTVVIGALIMLCISIYDAWLDHKWEHKQ